MDGFDVLAESWYAGATVDGQNITLNDGNGLSSTGGTASHTFHNTLMTQVGASHPSYGGSNNHWAASGSGIYQASGAGNYYLAANSSHREAGASGVDTDLKAALAKRTTHPPLVYEEDAELEEDTDWWPVVERDNGELDLGYHYPPIDYAVNDLGVPSGVTLTVHPGTALAAYGYRGLIPKDNSTVKLLGHAENRIAFCRFESVQEQPQRWSGGSTSGNSTYYLIRPNGGTSATKALEARFTDFHTMDDYYQRPLYTQRSSTYRLHELTVRDCRFYNGRLFLRGYNDDQHTFENNLFAGGDAYYSRVELTLFNNLFTGAGTRFYQNSSASTWIIKDNVFDASPITNSTWSGTVDHNHNGYINNGSDRINSITASDDVVLTGSFYYASSHGGAYYQSSTGLENEGSTSAGNAGLYHYTVHANQAKEGASILDLGFHHVARDGDGAPLDSDGDGLPDYLEDYDGDGVHQSATETNWQASENGTSSGDGRLQVFTVLE